MAPVFASADIAALVACFPPPLPRGETGRFLVQNATKSHFNISDTVLEKVKTLLKTSSRRVRLVDVSTKLDIDNVKAFLDAYGVPVEYSRDRQSILPSAEIQSILDQFWEVADQRLVDIGAFASEKDIQETSLLESVHTSVQDGTLLDFTDELAGSKRYFMTSRFATELKEGIKKLVNEREIERVNLSESFPTVPPVLLRDLAHDVVSSRETHATESPVRLLNDQVVFEPSGYVAAKQRQREERLENKAIALCRQIDEQRYCIHRLDDLNGRANAKDFERYPKEDEVLIAFRKHHNIDDAEVIWPESDLIVIIEKEKFQSTMRELRHAAEQQTLTRWHTRKDTDGLPTLGETVREYLRDFYRDSELTTMLLKSKHGLEVDECIASSASELKRKDKEAFDQAFTERVLTPVHLYSAGISTIVDVTLKQHLEEFVGEYVRRDVIPPALNTFREQKLLVDKAKAREMEKLKQSCDEARSFSDIQGAVMRCTKKMKIDSPNQKLLQRVKQQTLEQKAKGVQKMARGSDVLQNLVWVLLAQRSEGLFMSSGKDTSRMIKQYQSIGVDETAQQLEQWRDMLKSGSVGMEDLQVMRDMASKVTEGLLSPQQRAAVSTEIQE